MDAMEAERCRRILEQFELEGAKNSSIIPGVREFLTYLDSHEIRCAVVTRNRRAMAEMALRRCKLEFGLLISREDGPAKPDPWAIEHVCQCWGFLPEQVVMLGDFRFDVEAGRSAGAKTVFFTRGRNLKNLPGLENADFALDSFEQTKQLLDWLGIGVKNQV